MSNDQILPTDEEIARLRVERYRSACEKVIPLLKKWCWPPWDIAAVNEIIEEVNELEHFGVLEMSSTLDMDEEDLRGQIEEMRTEIYDLLRENGQLKERDEDWMKEGKRLDERIEHLKKFNDCWVNEVEFLKKKIDRLNEFNDRLMKRNSELLRQMYRQDSHPKAI